jgi:hypothetical protein
MLLTTSEGCDHRDQFAPVERFSGRCLFQLHSVHSGHTDVGDNALCIRGGPTLKILLPRKKRRFRPVNRVAEEL